ncbi:hypothetical protein H8356DRAFT_1326730 [Neocallimastix lanati (nom. inval.)]|nr:hypothetical protein H8356DRAFT_1326730 [Neocallimastix sp. JGI-2020a]
MVKYLVKHGDDKSKGRYINEENQTKRTPLLYAFRSGNVKYLIEQRADINKEDKYKKHCYIMSVVKKKLRTDIMNKENFWLIFIHQNNLFRDIRY